MVYDRNNYMEQPLSNEEHVVKLFKTMQLLTIFEIGACEGEDSIKYSRLFPNSKIYTFEPLPNNFNHIQSNISKYNVKNIYPYNKALSSKNGVAEFFVSEGRPADAADEDWDFGNKSSSLLPPKSHVDVFDFVKFEHRIEVETVTLETFCKENNIKVIDFIHMDVQGAELMVLEGAASFISSIKAIWLEVSTVHLYKDQPLVNDVQQFMAKHDFVLLKDCLNDIQGDQLYVSKKYFPDYKKLALKMNKKPFLNKLLDKFKNKTIK